MKRMLGIGAIDYWVRQPFLNRARGAMAARTPSGALDFFLIPLVADLGRRMVLTWDGPANAPQLSANEVRSANRVEFDYTAANFNNGQLFVRFWGSDQEPRKVRVVPLEHERLDQEFDPDVLSDLRGFDGLRFMDFLRTNDTNADHLTFARPDAEAYGAAGTVEEALALANAVGARPWINHPHRSTDDAIREAMLFIDRKSDRPSKNEFSNEIVWNGGFQQSAYAHVQAPEDPNGWVGSRVAALLRAAQDTANRVVAAGQLVNPWHLDMQLAGVLRAGADPRQLEALSPATYVAGDLADYSVNPHLARDLARRDDVDGALAQIMKGVAQQQAYIAAYVDRAVKLGAAVDSYEGASFGLQCNGSTDDWQELRRFYEKVQLSSGAPAVLRAYDEAFVRAGGRVQGTFDYASPSTEWGFYGVSLQPLNWAYLKESMEPSVPTPSPMPPVSESSPVPTPAPAPIPAPPTPAEDVKPTKDQIYAALAEVDRATTKARALVKAYRK